MKESMETIYLGDSSTEGERTVAEISGDRKHSSMFY